MTLRPLKYLSEAKLEQLRRGVEENLHRYGYGDFQDLEQENGWSIESRVVTIDTAVLATLDGTERTAQADAASSITVYRALQGMTPALAREERVWARLAHIECLEYSRLRWLAGLDGEVLAKAVRRHVFAPGRTGIRDDNALSRLWWNMHIAAIADPGDPERALRLIAGRADTRMQFVERANTASRPPLARAVLRAMQRDTWITSSESAFRKFMEVLNRECGGVLFEVLPEAMVDTVMDRIAKRARGEER